MANWCSNTVEFIGENDQFEELEKFFSAMAEKERAQDSGQLPAFTKEETGYLFETRWEQGILYYETKWGPNIEVIIEIADYFSVGFCYDYAEPGMAIYGVATYKDGDLLDISLSDEETEQYKYDEETDLYSFEGENYESEDEIVEILLARKKREAYSAEPSPNKADPAA